MARLFDDASTERGYVASCPITAYPFTMACWLNTDDNTRGQWVMQLYNTTSGHYLALQARGDIVSDRIWAQSYNGSTAQASVSNYAINQWIHIVAQFNSISNRWCWYNNTKSSISSATIAVDMPNAICIADNERIGSNCLSGAVAEAAVWNYTLTDADVTMLYRGLSPLRVQPAFLQCYWPLVGQLSPEIDVVGGYDLILENTPTALAHPKVFYPRWSVG